MAQITECVASPASGTPLFVPATDAIRALHEKAQADGVAIDWESGVSVKVVNPQTATMADGTEVPIPGVVLVQASADTVET